MVKFDDNTGTTHDLNEYAQALEVCKDFPRLISVYSKLLPVLYQMAHYQAVWPVIKMVEDSKLLAEMQFSYYKKIQLNKGKVTDDKQTRP